MNKELVKLSDIEVFKNFSGMLDAVGMSLNEFKEKQEEGYIKLLTCGDNNSSKFTTWNLSDKNLTNSIIQYLHHTNYNDVVIEENEQENNTSDIELAYDLIKHCYTAAIKDTKDIYLFVDKKLTLTQDNGSCNNKYGLRDGRYSIKVTTSEVELLAKSFFNWKTPTKKFNSYLERLNSLGSHERDKFIAWAYPRFCK